MRPNLDAGQNLFSRSTLAVLGLLAIVTLAAAIWFLQGAPPPVPEAGTPPDPASATVPEPPIPRPLLVMPAAVPRPEPSPPVSDPLPTVSEPEPSLALLERRFHATRAKEERIEIAAEIGGRNDADAVASLSRLFQAEAHPAVKAALLADLNEIDRDTAPELRLRTLAAALRGQPRNVRETALDSLAQLDDPQVAPLLKQAMTADPDREIREIAAALYRARFAPER